MTIDDVRAYHAKAVADLNHYADDSGLRDSDVKHYRKRAQFHADCLACLAGLVEQAKKMCDCNQGRLPCTCKGDPKP